LPLIFAAGFSRIDSLTRVSPVEKGKPFSID
jgi:hypothetical protein